MVNQFADQHYGEFCEGHNTTAAAAAGLLPGPLAVPPAQLAFMSGRCGAADIVKPSAEIPRQLPRATLPADPLLATPSWTFSP